MLKEDCDELGQVSTRERESVQGNALDDSLWQDGVVSPSVKLIGD